MARYTVGIDLGTSHTVVAYALAGAQTCVTGDAAIALFPIEQPVGPGAVAAQALLPSVRYHPAEGELGATDGPSVIMGRYAQDLGAQVPGRLVTSAKSWLSHPGVDRTAAILPWGGAEGVAKVSPVAASASYLAHVRGAWNARFPHAPLEQQDIVLTVPASFDEGARNLTLEAAHQAGLPTLRLLEEPQAAFHDWLFRHRGHWADALAHSHRVLVCDVGGGTTDLTLIEVDHRPNSPEGPRLTRIGVGDHLMLGGDNMDLALAHHVERELGEGAALSASRWAQLVQRCRVAKEQLLAADAPESVAITLLGAGAQLMGGARSVVLTRDTVIEYLVEGFFPQEGPQTRPRRRQGGIVELGLPYAADAAITRHIAAFLARHAQVTDPIADPAEGLTNGATAGLPVPDTLLLNGGVFQAPRLAARLEQVLAQWRGAPLQVLHNDAPDLAVARGAVAYALVRAHRVPELGAGIGGGSARSYFLVLEQGGGPSGICVLPRGTESGHSVDLSEHTFALRLGQAVRFHLASSVASTPWQAGQVVDLTGEGWIRLPPMSTVLPILPGGRRGTVRVQLATQMTEVGTLEVTCVNTESNDQRWSLAFQLRGDLPSDADAMTVEPLATRHPRLGDAVALLDRVFGPATHGVNAKEVRQVRMALERLLGPRASWDLPLLRALFDALWVHLKRRRRSVDHERVWFNLAGYCLRPGFGAPLDEWRMEQLWPLFAPGIQHTTDSRQWSEWWTLWRRVSGGLNDAQQLELLQEVGERLEKAVSAPRSADPCRGSYDDMVRLLAVLERVPVVYRIEMGDWLAQRLQQPGANPQGWWALGRMGARVSASGNAEQVVPPDTATRWLHTLLTQDWKAVEPAAFAAAQIARLSGDRTRDLPPECREAVIQKLMPTRAPASWTAMVREVVQLDEADLHRSFGDGLPPGLRWLNSIY